MDKLSLMLTVDSVDNVLQTAVLFICTFLAARRAFEQRSRAWTLLALFFGNYALDDLYLLLCELTVGSLYTFSVTGDLSWYAALLFLYLLIRQAAPMEERMEKRLLPWLGVAFCLGMAVYYIVQWGEIVSNLIYAGLMGLIMFASLRRLIRPERFRKARLLCAMALTLCLLVYASWTVSGLFKEGILYYSYYLFDFLITLSFPFFIVGTRKAVEE